MPSERGPFNHRYLRVPDLARLRNLWFRCRRPVEGQYAGRHLSPLRGHCIEFNDYREYAAGDEPGDIDWKVYGRSDRLFVRLFEHQGDMNVNLLVDASASMGYAGCGPVGRTGHQPRSGTEHGGSTGLSKYDQACLMAAAIAFLAIRQQDRAALGVARQGLQQHLAASGSFAHLDRMLQAMADVSPGGRAMLPEALRDLARRTRRKGLLVLFSDLAEDRAAILRELASFAFRGHEVLVFQILHADELKLPELGQVLFADSETGRRVSLNVADVRPAYERRLRATLQSWRAALRARGIDHHVVSTDTAYHAALEGYLVDRASAM